MSNLPQYQPSWSSVFLAIARGEHLQAEAGQQLHYPATCPNCMSEDTKPLDEEGKAYVCTNCGDTFERHGG